MQVLFGDFRLPCACPLAGVRVRVEVDGGTAFLGVACPTCGARIMEPLNRIDVIFARGIDLRNGLGASGLTWPPKENKS
jgi:hypothetical protein